jgi:tetratricopeptide (TPR) repeat protein
MMMLHVFSVFALGLASVQPSSPSSLGTVSFPTSCSSAAQPHIERGVALLHSFQYEEAAQEFEAGANRDTSCAMCHWGKAMTRFHPLWGEWPTAETFDAARRDIIRAQRTGSPTIRERGYIAATAAFFDASPRTDRRGRLRAYARQLERLHRQFPDDGEAAAFYALSLVTLASEGVDDLANRRRAINILDPLLRQQPNHPGAPHYLIHAADRPDLALLGLEAARRYADIAPDSSHALHMPSHIFVRLGLWDEAIVTNVRAAAAGAHAVMEHRGDYTYQIHAMEFLNYAYLQRGLEAKAREQHDALSTVPGASEKEKLADRALFAGRAAIELHRWQEAAALAVPDLDPSWLSDAYWARTIGAAGMRNIGGARNNLTNYRESVRALLAGRGPGARVPPTVRIAQLEAEGWVAFAEGQSDEALRTLRQAATLEAEEVGESVVVPAREMLADLLVELGRPAAALREYESVLKAAPNRFNTLLGAARASMALGDRSKARAYYHLLLAVAAPDADRAELRHARAFVDGR